MENYKEKYEQSLENIKKIKDANKNNKALVDFIEYKYPELKESEDEKMKNFISNELACLRATDERGSDRFKELTNAIAWLEKQEKIVEEYEDKLNRISCESFDKGYKAALEKQGEQNTTNKVETKFHKRDWITIDNPCQIISIDRNYIVQYCDDEKTREISKKFCEFYFHLWTIRDAKNGDILTLNDEYFLFVQIHFQERHKLLIFPALIDNIQHLDLFHFLRTHQ